MRNTNFTDYVIGRPYSTDILAEANAGYGVRRIIRTNADTFNTPFKSGLTVYRYGVAYVNMISTEAGTIIFIPDGSPQIYIRSKDNGSWSNWKRLIANTDSQSGSISASVPANSYTDISVTFESPFNAVPSVVSGFNGKPATIGAWCYCYAHSITSIGFAIRITNVTNGMANPSVNWIAHIK